MASDAVCGLPSFLSNSMRGAYRAAYTGGARDFADKTGRFFDRTGNGSAENGK